MLFTGFIGLHVISWFQSFRKVSGPIWRTYIIAIRLCKKKKNERKWEKQQNTFFFSLTRQLFRNILSWSFQISFHSVWSYAYNKHIYTRLRTHTYKHLSVHALIRTRTRRRRRRRRRRTTTTTITTTTKIYKKKYERREKIQWKMRKVSIGKYEEREINWKIPQKIVYMKEAERKYGTWMKVKRRKEQNELIQKKKKSWTDKSNEEY